MNIKKTGRKCFLIAACTLGAGAFGGVASVPFWATDNADAARVLTDAKLTPTTVGGYAWQGCSRTYLFSTKFSAVTQNGKTVDGAVCKNLFSKGSTLRINGM